MNAPFRLVAPDPAEQDLHETVARLLGRLLLAPAEWAHYPAGSVQLPAAAAAKLSRMGLRRGIPDFLHWHEARTYGLELKTRDGALSRTRTVRTKRGGIRILEGQADVFPRLRRAGMCIAVCRDVDAVLLQLDAWGLPLRGGWRTALTCAVTP